MPYEPEQGEYSLYLSGSWSGDTVNQNLGHRRPLTAAYAYELHSGEELIDNETRVGRDRHAERDLRQMRSLERALYKMEGPAHVTVLTTSKLVEDTINNGNERFEELMPDIHGKILAHVEEKDIDLWAGTPDEDDEAALNRLAEMQQELRRLRREFERTMKRG